jgi:DNA-binding NarL/FixJ family response regulator
MSARGLACTHCGALARGVKSEKVYVGCVRARRYVCDEGHSFRTYEVPSQLFRAFARSVIKARLKRLLNGIAQRKKTYEFHSEVRHRLEQGWKPAAIAHELGCAVRTVEKLRAKNEQSGSRQAG